MLQLKRVIEVVLNRSFAFARHDDDVFHTRFHRFFDDVLNGRFVDDRQHFLRHRFGCRQKTRAESCGGYDGLANHGHSVPPASSLIEKIKDLALLFFRAGGETAKLDLLSLFNLIEKWASNPSSRHTIDDSRLRRFLHAHSMAECLQ